MLQFSFDSLIADHSGQKLRFGTNEVRPPKKCLDSYSARNTMMKRCTKTPRVQTWRKGAPRPWRKRQKVGRKLVVFRIIAADVLP